LKFKIMMAMAGVAVFAVSGPMATAGNGDKVTGGGQVLFGTETEAGRSSTIAFTAQQSGTQGTAAKGQLQLVDRTQGKGQAQTRYHGVVTCIETGQLDPQDEDSPGFGVVSGYQRGDADKTPRFLLRVIDNGQPNEGNDMIAFEKMTQEDTCGDGEDDPEVEGELAKGNVKVRDGDPTNQPEPEDQNGTGSALSVLGL